MKRQITTLVLTITLTLGVTGTGLPIADTSIPVKADEPLVETTAQSGYQFMDVDITGLIENPLLKLDSLATSGGKTYYTTNQEAALYIRKRLKLHEDKIVVGIRTTNSDAQKVFYNIWDRSLKETADGSEGDYLLWNIDTMKTSYTTRTAKKKGKLYYYYTFIIENEYYITYAQEQELTSKIRTIEASFGFTDTTSEYDKITTIYDYICNNVEYSYDNDDIKYTAYAAVYSGSAVCQGYATLFYRMAIDCGISSRVIAGYGSSEGVYHGWNIVKLGNLYYNVDSTWDADRAMEGETYLYYLKGDNFTGHSRYEDYKTDEFYATYPMASSDYGTGDYTVAQNTVDAIFKTTKAKIKKVTRKKIKLTKVANAQGYEIKYSTSSNFRKKKTKTVKTKKLTYKLKKIKKTKTYYFKVRAYKEGAVQKIHTKWSKVKKVKKVKKK